MSDRVEVLDPFAAADEAQFTPRTLFGELDLQASFCALVKGKGKVPWDTLSEDERIKLRKAVSIEMCFIPLPELKFTNNIERNVIANSNSWIKVTLPSLKELGINSKDANGKWFKAELAPTGRKWRGKDGVEHEETTLKFLAVFNSVDECRKAMYIEVPELAPDPNFSLDEESPLSGEFVAEATPVVDEKERATAEQFVRTFAASNRANPSELYRQIESIPMLNRYFPVGSDALKTITDEVWS